MLAAPVRPMRKENPMLITALRIASGLTAPVVDGMLG
jgi:hypothetical protein